jgi:hypothetical protein
MFLIAQFAGVVPRAAVAQPGVAALAASLSLYQHKHDCAEHDKIRHQHSDDSHGNIADQCCALHLLAGVVPLVISATSADLPSRALVAAPVESDAGIGAPPLYRPPRSLWL